MVNVLYRVMSTLTLNKLKKKLPIDDVDKSKKRISRFDGLTEEEVQKYTLPDYLEMNLDIVFVGINPSLMAAHRGRYYAGPGNHFYKLLHESGLLPRYLSYEEDYKLPQYGIGLTNIVTRATRSSADLKRAEIKEGSKIVEEKLKIYKPKIAVFNGKCIYDVFADKTGNFNFGLQPEHIGETTFWVTPSSSARCANFPRMIDKLHFFTSLKKYLRFMKGELKDIDIKEFSFEGKCKQFIPSTSKMWRRKNLSVFLHGGRIANKDTVCLDTSDENVAVAHSTEFIVTKLQSDKNESFKAYTSQNNVQTFLKDSELPRREDAQIPNSTKSVKSKKKNNNSERTVKSEMLIVKRKTNSNTRKKGIQKLPQKPVRCNDFENNTDLEFVNLIKQRLVKKRENRLPDENNVEDK